MRHQLRIEILLNFQVIKRNVIFDFRGTYFQVAHLVIRFKLTKLKQLLQLKRIYTILCDINLEKVKRYLANL